MCNIALSLAFRLPQLRMCAGISMSFMNSSLEPPSTVPTVSTASRTEFLLKFWDLFELPQVTDRTRLFDIDQKTQWDKQDRLDCHNLISTGHCPQWKDFMNGRYNNNDNNNNNNNNNTTNKSRYIKRRVTDWFSDCIDNHMGLDWRSANNCILLLTVVRNCKRRVCVEYVSVCVHDLTAKCSWSIALITDKWSPARVWDCCIQRLSAACLPWLGLQVCSETDACPCIVVEQRPGPLRVASASLTHVSSGMPHGAAPVHSCT